MPYRIVEATAGTLDHATAIGEYDSPYRALDDMRRTRQQRGHLDWFLLDPAGRVLLEPTDLIDT